jgi:hypothetical protein
MGVRGVDEIVASSCVHGELLLLEEELRHTDQVVAGPGARALG